MSGKARQEDEIRQSVRASYARRATSGECGCDPRCCSTQGSSVSRAIGYAEEELRAVPRGADLGLGCGNPTALAALKEGDVVLDLGSGAGIDCFLAARRVGPTGRAIGVDMTPEMIDRARENARSDGADNVEFRLGEIEHLPVADASVDVVISNCVINLSPDKPRVFREALRVLRPGGRLLVSDIVLHGQLPEDIRESMEAYTACVAGASQIEDYLRAIRDAGFEDVRVAQERKAADAFSAEGRPRAIVDGRPVELEELGLTEETARRLAATIASVSVTATRPVERGPTHGERRESSAS